MWMGRCLLASTLPTGATSDGPGKRDEPQGAADRQLDGRLAEISTADGRASPPFSEAPEVFLIFAPLSHTLRFASDVPKIACYNRLSPDA